MAKALDAEADAVLIDLEDSVAPSAKQEARRVAVGALRDGSDTGPALWVRINTGDIGRADARALATHAADLGGLLLAKCEDVAWLDEIASVIPDSVQLSPLVESALGLRRIDALCAHPRVLQCQVGEIDLLADLGAHGDASPQLLSHAHAEILFASAAAQILPPIGGVYPSIRDIAGLEVDSIRLAQLGFAGRPAIHPAQVPVIKAAFRPTAEEIDNATALVESYVRALARGQGVVTDQQGRMVDEAVIRRARQVIGGRRNDETESL